MPITPYHLGPGLLLKGLLPDRFSFSAFALTQAAIDTETLYYMVHHEHPRHRQMHTLIGGALVGGAVVLGVLAARKLFKSRERWRPLARAELAPGAAAVGGFIGGAAHIFLDAITHRDIRPFMPWTQANPLLGMMSRGASQRGCVISGILGLGLILFWLGRERAARPD